MGVVRGGWAGVEMVHPQLRAADDAALPDRLTPVYPTTEGLPQAWIRRRIDRLLATAVLGDTLPEALRIEHGLPELANVFRFPHHSPPRTDFEGLGGTRP